MSEKEVARLEVIQRMLSKTITQRQAAIQLGITDRQVRRLAERYTQEGAAGLTSRKRGKPSNRQAEPQLRQVVMQLLRDVYQGFGPTLACEYLLSDGYQISRETLRQWMISEGLWRSKRPRLRAPHPPRARRTRSGELIQIDGSTHAWFDDRGPKSTLIAFIDDATSEVIYACFEPAETTWAYLRGLKRCIQTYGIPLAFYSDRHTIFCKHRPEDFKQTQFERANAALGIETIQALSPQAKGRIERLFQTLQDRLVKALRLAKVDNIDAANVFLERYIAGHNAKFAVQPADPEAAYRTFEGSEIDLSRICAPQYERQISKNLAVSYMNQHYVIETHDSPCYTLQKSKVTVIEHENAPIELVWRQKSLSYRVLTGKKWEKFIADHKTINSRVDQAIGKTKTGKKSASGSPWRVWVNYAGQPPK